MRPATTLHDKMDRRRKKKKKAGQIIARPPKRDTTLPPRVQMDTWVSMAGGLKNASPCSQQEAKEDMKDMSENDDDCRSLRASDTEGFMSTDDIFEGVLGLDTLEDHDTETEPSGLAFSSDDTEFHDVQEFNGEDPDNDQVPNFDVLLNCMAEQVNPRVCRRRFDRRPGKMRKSLVHAIVTGQTLRRPVSFGLALLKMEGWGGIN